MNTPKHFQIPITTPLAEFKKHLEDPDNHRIFFNGKFGTGKTHFLNEYFNETNDFNAIHLYPVNYQVSSNDDIFELIKYDILLELVRRGWFEGKDELTKSLAVQSYILSEGGKTALKLLKCIPKIGKVVEAGEHLTNFITQYQHYESKLKRCNRDVVSDFIDNLQKKQGGHYEYDQISQIIRSVVDENGRDKLCLVIDDLDRIDPEHIFRILNVFSAHFDLLKDYENKFGFAKIIVVGDIDNIRNIFKAKYGMDADFNGYVDKFYSKGVFNFDNSTEVIANISSLIKMFIGKSNFQDEMFLEILRTDIVYLLTQLVLSHAINYRDLEGIFNRRYSLSSINSMSIVDPNIEDTRPSSFRATYIVDFLFFIFDYNKESMNEALNKASRMYTDNSQNAWIIAQMLLLLRASEVKFEKDSSNTALLDEESASALDIRRIKHGTFYKLTSGFSFVSHNKRLTQKNQRMFDLIKQVHNIVNDWFQTNKYRI